MLPAQEGPSGQAIGAWRGAALKRTVINGPFAETKELVAGFLQVKSLDEAIEWVKRAPNLSLDGEAEIEIRKVMDLEDFGDDFTPNPETAKVKIK